jgi:FixJ family two-component response regulator
MIKTEADLAKLTHRQREVLTLLARQLSNHEVARLLHIAEATTNIDAEALLEAYATVQEALSRGIITDDAGAGALKRQP